MTASVCDVCTRAQRSNSNRQPSVCKQTRTRLYVCQSTISPLHQITACVSREGVVTPLNLIKVPTHKPFQPKIPCAQPQSFAIECVRCINICILYYRECMLCILCPLGYHIKLARIKVARAPRKHTKRAATTHSQRAGAGEGAGSIIPGKYLRNV